VDICERSYDLSYKAQERSGVHFRPMRTELSDLEKEEEGNVYRSVKKKKKIWRGKKINRYVDRSKCDEVHCLPLDQLPDIVLPCACILPSTSA
jgi:hypothetical protein